MVNFYNRIPKERDGHDWHCPPTPPFIAGRVSESRGTTITTDLSACLMSVTLPSFSSKMTGVFQFLVLQQSNHQINDHYCNKGRWGKPVIWVFTDCMWFPYQNSWQRNVWKYVCFQDPLSNKIILLTNNITYYCCYYKLLSWNILWAITIITIINFIITTTTTTTIVVVVLLLLLLPLLWPVAVVLLHIYGNRLSVHNWYSHL